MTTLEFLTGGWNWLLEDWTHPIVAAAVFTAVTPTPEPGTWAAKLYSVVDKLALNVLHAKSTGLGSAGIAQAIVANMLAQQKLSQPPAVEPPKEKQ